jgi:hypothetical protein
VRVAATIRSVMSAFLEELDITMLSQVPCSAW